jgi:hypothetical protein
MGPITALDFTEQLMIFEACGMIYDNPEFVQASKVRQHPVARVSVHLLTCLQLPGLHLTTWNDFVEANDLLSLMVEA